MSVHSRHRLEIENPAAELTRVERIEKLLDEVDGELEQLYASTTRDSLRHRFQVGRGYGLARIREACELVLEPQAGRHV